MQKIVMLQKVGVMNKIDKLAIILYNYANF